MNGWAIFGDVNPGTGDEAFDGFLEPRHGMVAAGEQNELGVSFE
jgi:hypothetical protein